MPIKPTMNPNVLLAVQKIEAEIRARQNRLGIRKLTDALCFALHIPDGRELALRLTTDPSVRNNRDAVAAWLLAQMADPSVALGQEALPIFQQLLSRKLLEIAEGTAWN